MAGTKLRGGNGDGDYSSLNDALFRTEQELERKGEQRRPPKQNKRRARREEIDVDVLTTNPPTTRKTETNFMNELLEHTMTEAEEYKQARRVRLTKRAKMIATGIIAVIPVGLIWALLFDVQALLAGSLLIVFLFFSGTAHRTITAVLKRLFLMRFYATLALVLGLSAITFITMADGGIVWRVALSCGGLLGLFAFLLCLDAASHRTSTIEVTRVEETI